MEIIYGYQQKKNHVIQKWNYLPHHGTIAINSSTNYTTAFDFRKRGREIHNFPIQQLKTISIYLHPSKGYQQFFAYKFFQANIPPPTKDLR
jgi:hypothetical protein